MNEKRQNGEKNEAEQIHSKQVRNVKTELITVISMKELHHQRGAHGHAENNHDAAHQSRKLGQVRRPLRIGERVMHFVGAVVPLLPRQNACEVRDHRDQKQIERPRNYLEQAVRNWQEGVSEAFCVAEDQRRHAVQQRKSRDHNKRRRLHQPLEFDFYRTPELQPFRASAEIPGCYGNCRGGDRNALLSSSLLLSGTSFRKTESPVGESKDHRSNP